MPRIHEYILCYNSGNLFVLRARELKTRQEFHIKEKPQINFQFVANPDFITRSSHPATGTVTHNS